MGEGRSGRLGLADANWYRIDEQQGPAIEHRELDLVSCDKPCCCSCLAASAVFDSV